MQLENCAPPRKGAITTLQARSSRQLWLGFFHLPVFQFHWRVATEDAYTNPKFAALGIDFLNDTLLILEGTVGNLHLVSDLVDDLGGHSVFTLFHLSEHSLDFFLAHRDGLVLGAGKSDDPRGVLDKVPSLVNEFIVLIEEVHIDDEISREKLAGCFRLLTALDLLHSLGRNEHLEDMISEFFGRDPLDDIVVDFFFLPGEDVDNEPLFFWC